VFSVFFSRPGWLVRRSEIDAHELARHQQSDQLLAAALRRGARSLHEVLEPAPLPEGTRLLIVVDQFEEIFRYRTQAEDQAAAFVALLLESCRHEDIYIVITMRSDFLGKAAEFQGLPEAINEGLYLTPRLTREQLTDAIGKPARLFGGGVQEELANQLCNEAGNNPDQLPLLQHALMRLWEQDQDKTLTLDEYGRLNGLQGALDGHAEQAWKELDAGGQRIAESLFRALTERSREGQDIRRPVKVREVLDLTKVSLGTLTRAVDVFREPGRNFLMASPSGELEPDTTLDISHESLIRQWRRLRGWVAAEGEKADMLKRLSEAAERHRNKQGELWRGTDLALALKWREEQQPTVQWAGRYLNVLSPHPNPLPGGEGNRENRFSQTGEENKEPPLSRPGEGGGEGMQYQLAMRFLAKSAAVERRRKYLKWGGTGLAFVLLAIFAAVQYRAAQAERERRSPIYRAEDWVRIEPGEFCMGSRGEGDPLGECPDAPVDPEAQDDEKPVHRVKIAKPFLLARHEVTFEEYDRFFYDNLDKGLRLPSDSGFGAGLDPEQRKRLPVINVSWQDARDYAAWLSGKTGKDFRLPTEAEWEYAARAETLTPRPWEGGLEAACRHANVFDSKHAAELRARWNITWDNFPCEDNYATTAPVGSFQANAFGLHDMLGNVWEWVQDCYHESYNGAPADGTVWEKKDCSQRVVRGGSWNSNPATLRSATRSRSIPGNRNGDLGFRLVQDI